MQKKVFIETTRKELQTCNSMLNRSSVQTLLYLLVILIIFRPWFSQDLLSGGDWIYLFPKAIEEITPFSAWDSTFNGMGQSIIPTLWHQSYSFTALKAGSILPWFLYERIFWFIPYIVFSSFSSYLLFNRIFRNKFLSLFSSFIYLINTYSLMLVSGGQMGVALAYSFFPFLAYFYLRTIKERLLIRNSLICGLALSLLIVFDLRIGYVSQVFVGLLVIWVTVFNRRFRDFPAVIFYIFIIPGILTILLHAFWLLPLVILGQNPTESFAKIYSTIEAVKFFSFANFENSFSLLHPNWPENIFGKTYFMRPEFILLPILAFSSLLFLNKFKNLKEKRYVLFFSLLGLIGAFLAKGANEPFGEIYIWLFENFPGFVMFRDPTKWYVLIAISYSILIPYSIEKIYILLKEKFR